MAIEILTYKQVVPARDQAAFGNDPKFVDHIRSHASRVLADKILRDESIYEYTPPDDKDDPFSEGVHRWTIGIETSADAVALRRHQINEAANEKVGRIVEQFEKRVGEWGAYYGRDTIRKDEAIRFLAEAIRAAKEP